MLKKQETGTYSVSNQYYRLFSARDKAIKRGVKPHYKLSDGGIENYVEEFGFKKTLEMIKGL